MKTHRSLTDEEFIARLEATTLDSSLFGHEAHLRLAWLNLKRYDRETALNITCDQIQKYVMVLGALDKFNITLTIAAVEAVYRFLHKTPQGSFMEFIGQHPQLTSNFKALVQTHYSFDIFNDQGAKKTYIAPDLIPFS